MIGNPFSFYHKKHVNYIKIADMLHSLTLIPHVDIRCLPTVPTHSMHYSSFSTFSIKKSNSFTMFIDNAGLSIYFGFRLIAFRNSIA